MNVRVKETFESVVLCESRQDEVVVYSKGKLKTFKRSEIVFEDDCEDLGWNYSLIDKKLSNSLSSFSRTIKYIIKNGICEYTADNVQQYFRDASINAIKTKFTKSHWSLIEDLIYSEDLNECEEAFKEWEEIYGNECK